MTTLNSSRQAVLQGARFFLAHTPGLVEHGSKPSREVSKDPSLLPAIRARLRSFEDAAAYPPHRVLLGDLYPDRLWDIERPWHQTSADDVLRCGPHGQLMPEEEFYALLKQCDPFNLVSLEDGFAAGISASSVEQDVAPHGATDLTASVFPISRIETKVNDPSEGTLPLHLRDGRLIGCMASGHSEDASLTADVLLENLSCKATAVAALRTLLRDEQMDPGSIDYVINCGEEAVGDRYQRGGGNLGKAVAEACGCDNATGSDVKAFCCGPVHGLVMAAALVNSGLYDHVAVVGGCSLAKLGMKFQSHLEAGMPVLEDVLVGLAVLVSADDGVHPLLRLDSVGRHSVGAGSSQQAILGSLVREPLSRLALRYGDVDKYATELHNPEITEPAASGDVPAQNYRLIAAMATLDKEITREDMPNFVRQHGMPGFSPTQGHIASAMPFLGHAIERIIAGDMQRAMFLAKGSLFLGRMTHMSDGMSFILERNPSVVRQFGDPPGPLGRT